MKPTVVCAWCTRVMSEGTRDVSHGICNSCARDVLRTAEENWRDELGRHDAPRQPIFAA